MHRTDPHKKINYLSQYVKSAEVEKQMETNASWAQESNYLDSNPGSMGEISGVTQANLPLPQFSFKNGGSGRSLIA